MKIIFKNSFLKEIEEIRDKKLKKLISEAIRSADKANSIDQIHKIKRLSGFTKYYRIRIGDYRIGLFVEDDLVYFVTFIHRKDIYKRFP